MTKRILLLLFILGLGSSLAFGQVAITGQIRGVVTDASGGALPNVSITVKSPALMTSRTTATDVAGGYLFDSLPSGIYELTYTISGFKTEVRSNISITPGFTATVSPELAIGTSEQSVVVSAAAPVVDTTDNTSTTTFDEALLQNVPSGRDTFSTVAQAPGVATSDFDIAGSQSFQQSVMQVHGSLPGDQVYSFNGLRLNWPGSTGGYTSFYVDDDSLSELQVVTDSAPAEVAVGGVYMNLVPKSGANQMHGLAAAYYQSAGTQATISNPIYGGVPVPSGTPFIMARDIATNLGGPILKDKWWIFGSWRLYDLKESVLSVTNPDGTPTTDPNHQSNVTLRSDYQLTKNNHLDFVWWYNEQNRFFRRDTSYAFVSADAAWRQIEPAYILQGEWTSTVKNMLFDTRFGYLHQVFPLENQPGTPLNALNRQDVTLSTESGAPPYSFVNPASVIAFAEGVSYYNGHLWGSSHTFKFGVDSSVNRNGYNYTVDQGINALYNNTKPIEVIAYNTPVNVRSIYHETAAYAQDSVTIKRKLTLNLGVRYDHFNTFYPAQTSPAATFPALFPQRTFAKSPDIATWNTFRPRLGMAYDLTGKGRSVIRAYYGQFDIIEGAGLAEQINPNGLSTQVYNWNDLNGDGVPQQNEWDSPANLVSASGGVVTKVDPNLKRPYTSEFNVGYEQQVLSSVMVGVNYYYRNIKNQFAERNLANPATDYTATKVDNLGNPLINSITGQQITLYNLNPADVGLSNYLITNIPELDTNHYNGIEFTMTKRMSRGWQVLAGYTLQQQKGTYTRGLTDDFNNPNNEINRKSAILNYDATQMFKILSNYTLPKSIALGLNYQHYTGYPLDPNNGPPTAVFENLNQGQVSVIGDTIGHLRLPNVDIANIRLSRPTHLGDRFTLEPIADLFNIANANTVISEVPTGGSSFRRPTNQLNPFIARFAMRFSF
ncbi:TonB-dependent receptor [Acidipila rosea]|uniref:Carboxypeptidase family protein n=1 Tax=Acidipila rosea TaxID=768535 RepID=A0A4R1L1F7_9BACT|nr:TonB-dependent receptor [Acidipila rosea]MBW4027412.1 TonB-dependent receptor [Acidobacteriota bacterium]MBW4045591.1 TonB-dependent receptor [Acidobacteriota bacterium]TCK71684.1 carboxypeptidase family protein [Acidipila rosea]